MRSDLPLGVLAAMVVHAAGETGPAPEQTRAVVLAARSELELLDACARAGAAGHPPKMIVESEGFFRGQAMAAGWAPSSNPGLRSALSSLPLLKER